MMKNLFTITGLALFATLNFGNVERSNANAFQQTQNEVAPSDYLKLTSMCSNDPSVTRRWRVRNLTSNPIPYTWDVYGAGQLGSGLAQPGDSFFETVTVPGTPNTTRIFWVVEGTAYQTVKASGGAQCAPTTCYAEEVVSFNQQKRNDGSTIDAIRSNPAKALGAPEANDTENFVSLGFGGDITLKFGSPIKNGEGNDVRVVESTFGNIACNRFPERIRAFASQDGCNFVYLGEQCQDAEFDLGMLGWAQYIKLVDVSPVDAPYQGTPIADAYDVDGVMCLNGFEANPVLAPVTAGANSVINYTPGMRKNGTPVPAARANAENALGLPQGTDVVNFVALGFGGSIILKFNYVIFDNPTETDLQIVETSYGNPTCNAYPERAEVEGSLDGVNWVSLGLICQDGQIDITSAGTIQYVRITDRSAFSSFSGSADAFDLDGVVVINNNCGTSNTARWSDNTTTADEVMVAEVFPNPFQNDLNLMISTGSQDNQATITVSNYLGKLISSERINVAASSAIQHPLNVNNLSKGVYFISIETNTTKEVLKVVKQ
jgi:hypothetical protein